VEKDIGFVEVKLSYKKIVHYSKCTRYGDNHPGGVEKYSWYLQKAVGCELVTPNDKPDLNDPEVLYIVDNHWGLDIGSNCRVICVVHGCAGERGFNVEIGKLQNDMAGRPNTYFVANSIQTKELCEKYYNSRIDEIIYPAVDENLYYPREKKTAGLVVLTSTAGKRDKGAHVIGNIDTILGLQSRQHFVKDMKCALDEEISWFKDADIFVLLSIHEGFAYSILEAMCANLPVITGPHGIGYDLRNEGVIVVLDENDLWYPALIAEKIRDVLSSQEDPKTREWVLNNCTLEMFNEKWTTLIEREKSEKLQ
jgi:hypothetical protein